MLLLWLSLIVKLHFILSDPTAPSPATGPHLPSTETGPSSFTKVGTPLHFSETTPPTAFTKVGTPLHFPETKSPTAFTKVGTPLHFPETESPTAFTEVGTPTFIPGPSTPPRDTESTGGCRRNVTTRSFSGEPTGSYVLRSDRSMAPYAGKCPLNCLYKDLGWCWYSKGEQSAITSHQMIEKPGRVGTGGSVWNQEIVTAMETRNIVPIFCKSLLWSYIFFWIINSLQKFWEELPLQIWRTDHSQWSC